MIALGGSEPAQSAETLAGIPAALSGASFGTFSSDAATAQAMVGPWRRSRSDSNTAFSERYSFFADGTYQHVTISIVTFSGTESREEDSGRFFVVGNTLVVASTARTTSVIGFRRSGNFLTIDGISQPFELNGD